MVNLAIDGVGLKLAADAWAEAPAGQKPELLRVGQALLAVQTGLFYAWVAALLGLPFLLFGLALVLSRHYPAWAGWLGMVGGAVMLLYGAVQFHREIETLVPFFYRAALLPIAWMVAMGVLMWRRANAAPGPQVGEPADLRRGLQFARSGARTVRGSMESTSPSRLD